MTISACHKSLSERVFFVHTHSIPAGLDRSTIFGAVIVVETDAERLRRYYGREFAPLSTEGFLQAWPDLRSRLGLLSSTRCPLAVEDVTAAPDLYRRLEDYASAGVEVIQLFHWDENEFIDAERGRDQGGITGRICASCLMGAKKFPREG